MVTTGTDTLAAHVRGYAQAVRLHLADLAPDAVDDLTDGLEADLTEALLDLPDQGRLPQRAGSAPGASPGPGPAIATVPDDAAARTTVLDLTAVFGPARAYATELRSAAGLAQAPAGRGPARRRTAGGLLQAYEAAAARWADASRPVTSNPAWAAVRDFLRSLAPVWWVLRGWVLATVLLVPVLGTVVLWPDVLGAQLLIVAAIVLSVQWGRGRRLSRRAWGPRLVRVVSVGAAVAAVPLALHVATEGDRSDQWSYQAAYSEGYDQATYQLTTVGFDGVAGSDGVWVDGMQVSNLFAFDADGEPLRNVQLFDDRGRPVRTVTPEGTLQPWAVPDLPGDWYFQPAVSQDHRERWNVYPLQAVEAQDTETVYTEPQTGWPPRPVPLTGVRPESMPWPFLKAPTEIPSQSPVPDAAEEPATGDPDGDEPAEDPDAPASEDRPSVAPGGDRPASGTVPGGEQAPVAPTLEATDAD